MYYNTELNYLQEFPVPTGPGWRLATAEDIDRVRNPTPVVIDPKLLGVEFQGVMCSATKEDMWGLSSVAPWVEAGNSTAFEFDNGNTLVLTPDNYRAFTAVWGAYRASFFPVP